MERDSEYEMEEETHSDSSRERDTQGRRPYKGGKHIKEVLWPTTTPLLI